jgi:hypothetical protein
MAERADQRLPLKPKTKQLIDEEKPDGVTYDHWLRGDPRLPTNPDSV